MTKMYTDILCQIGGSSRDNSWFLILFGVVNQREISWLLPSGTMISESFISFRQLIFNKFNKLTKQNTLFYVMTETRLTFPTSAFAESFQFAYETNDFHTKLIQCFLLYKLRHRCAQKIWRLEGMTLSQLYKPEPNFQNISFQSEKESLVDCTPKDLIFLTYPSSRKTRCYKTTTKQLPKTNSINVELCRSV